jgi:ABC-2 type transport system permease protein
MHTFTKKGGNLKVQLYNLLKFGIAEILRIPIVMFFNNIFPIMMLFIFMTIFGNFEIIDGYKFIDKYYFIALVLGIIPITFVSLPMSISIFINSGIMETYVLFGIDSKVKITTDLIIHVLISFMQLFIVTILAFLIYQLHIPEVTYFLAFLLQYLLVFIAMSMIGISIALFFKNNNEVQSISLLIMFLALFLSGTFGDIGQSSEVLQKVAKLVPTTYLINDMFLVWQQQILFSKDLLICCSTVIIIFSSLNLYLANKRLDRKIGFSNYIK